MVPPVISERMVEQAGSLAPLLWWVVDAFEGAKRGLPEMAEDIEKVRKEVEDTLKNLNVQRPTSRLGYGGRSMEVGTSYKNPISGKVEEVGRRHPWENLGMCTRCRGFVEPPDDPGGVYTCCGCGLKFVVESGERDISEVPPSMVIPLAAAMRCGISPQVFFSRDSIARAEFVQSMWDDMERERVEEESEKRLMLELAIKGEEDVLSREGFVERLDSMANTDFIGLLGAKVRCMSAREAGVGWVLQDERTLGYLNLDHVSLLLSNTFTNRMGIVARGDDE